jgi:hypothetical protein
LAIDERNALMLITLVRHKAAPLAWRAPALAKGVVADRK